MLDTNRKKPSSGHIKKLGDMNPDHQRNKFPSFKVRPSEKKEEEAQAITREDLKPAFQLVKKVVEAENVHEALAQEGITAQYLAKQLKTCIEANDVRFDKHSNPIPGLNLKLRLQALKLVLMLRGDMRIKVEHHKGASEAIFDDIEVN